MAWLWDFERARIFPTAWKGKRLRISRMTSSGSSMFVIEILQ